MKRKGNTLGIDLVGVCVLATTLIASWIMTLQPAGERRQEVDSLRLSIQETTHRVRSLEIDAASAQRDVAAAAKALESVSVRLVSVDARNSRLAELTRLASTLGLTVDELSPHEPVKGELFDRVLIDVRGRGSYPDAAMFLHLIHDEFLDTEVRSFRITRNDGDAMFEIRLVWHATPSERLRRDIPGR
jgi:Tfp pilus assembly protein PilO